MSDNKTKSKEVFSGVVASPFKTKKKKYTLKDEYKTHDKRSFDYLVETGRVKNK